MLYKLSYVFLQFILFSMIGYLAEVIHVSFTTKKINFSRGFLIGPYLPIYGFSSVVMIFLLSRYEDDLFALFIMAAFVCTLLEYLTSLILEKIFKLRWWDYSAKKFNIEGRVCLGNSILFGLGGLLIIKLLNPWLSGILNLFSPLLLEIIALVLLVIFLTDFGMSLFILIRLDINVNKYSRKDATSEIRKEVRKSLEKYTGLTTRLLKSFPTLKSPNIAALNSFKNLALKTKEELKRVKRELKEKSLKEVKVVEEEFAKIEEKVEDEVDVLEKKVRDK